MCCGALTATHTAAAVAAQMTWSWRKPSLHTGSGRHPAAVVAARLHLEAVKLVLITPDGPATETIPQERGCSPLLLMCTGSYGPTV